MTRINPSLHIDVLTFLLLIILDHELLHFLSKNKDNIWEGTILGVVT